MLLLEVRYDSRKKLTIYRFSGLYLRCLVTESSLFQVGWHESEAEGCCTSSRVMLVRAALSLDFR